MKLSRDLRGISAIFAALLAVHRCLVDGHRVYRKIEEGESIGIAQCLDVVRKVQARGRYTEDFIAGVCADLTGSQRCEFFAEALALATVHSDFGPERFCSDIEQTQFCSENMEKLLISQPVADLAYGECVRAKRAEAEVYCKRFRSMLSYAVQNGDLDTMRACYVIQAYNSSNSSGTPEGAQPAEIPKMRIITSSGDELDSIGFGNATGYPRISDSGIVLQPRTFEDFGRGAGKPLPQREGTIIVAPKPVQAAAGQFLSAAVRAQSEAKTVPSRSARAASPTARMHVNGTPPQVAAMHVNTTAVQAAKPTATKGMKATTARVAAPNATVRVNGTAAQAAKPAAVNVTAAHEAARNATMLANGTAAEAAAPNATKAVVAALKATAHAEGAAKQLAVLNATTPLNGTEELAAPNATMCTNGTSADAAMPCRTANTHPAAAAVQIVTRAAPLSPLAGHMNLRAPPQRTSSTPRTKMGLAQQGAAGLARAAKGLKGGQRERVDGKKDSNGEYNGFLSKFVQ